MLKKIELPYFKFELYEDKQQVSKMIRLGDFYKWFAENIEPLNAMIENAVRVTGFIDPEYPKGQNYLFDNLPRKGSVDNNTHQAYLIGIEPIAKEDPKDVLRDLISFMEKHNSAFINSEHYIKAKRVLERTGE